MFMFYMSFLYTFVGENTNKGMLSASFPEHQQGLKNLATVLYLLHLFFATYHHRL